MSRNVVKRTALGSIYICPRCAHGLLATQQIQRQFSTSRQTKQRKHGDILNSSVLGLMEERGYINQIAGDRNVLKTLLRSKKLGFYAGIDPTAPSLHLGHLLPLMVLYWVSLYGHNVVSLVGGGTARVGDPAGRLTSRGDVGEHVQTGNFQKMFAQTKSLWERVPTYATRHGREKREMGEHIVVDNSSWLDELNVLDFLKTLGNGMRVGTMLKRDT